MRIPALALLLLIHAEGDPFSDWMKSLMRPDFDGPCCGPSDQYYPESYWRNPDGSFEAIVGGVDVHVPANKVIWDRVNPMGRGVLFISRDPKLWAGGFVFCFVPGSGV